MVTNQTKNSVSATNTSKNAVTFTNIGYSFLLQEDGFYILCEDSSRILLEESTANPPVTFSNQAKNNA